MSYVGRAHDLGWKGRSQSPTVTLTIDSNDSKPVTTVRGEGAARPVQGVL